MFLINHNYNNIKSITFNMRIEWDINAQSGQQKLTFK